MAEEAEREARIAEEQATLGESDRAAEARELQALLDPLGLVVRDILVRLIAVGLGAKLVYKLCETASSEPSRQHMITFFQ